MKRMTWLRGALALAVMTGVSWAVAADHIDAPAVVADPTTDITDLYTWVEGSNVVFALDVTPLATMTSKFSDKVQYVIHTESTDTFGKPGVGVDIICTFAVDQKISCWVGDKDYVTGDASPTMGIKSMGGKFTVFAGLRDDPFYFNLDGFKDAVATVDMAAPALMFNPAGCPKVDAVTSMVLVNKLKSDPTSPGGTGPGKDFFAGKNVLAIVLSVDKSLLNGGGAIMNAWASTNVGG
jgi:Domain of unknown function (DUF4331)